MTVAQYLVNKLVDFGATDVFGVPGGVILDFVYEAQKQVRLHLNYHEQASGFAALGYAQSGRSLGVCYATRGPGFTNLLTPMADAYYCSVPVLFITAHSKKYEKSDLFLQCEQEFDTVSMCQDITKIAARIESVKNAAQIIDEALDATLHERRGPVFLDFLSGIFNAEAEIEDTRNTEKFVRGDDQPISFRRIAELIADGIAHAEYPVLLIGDGISQTKTNDAACDLADKLNIPVLSSRFAQSIAINSPLYFGFIGSHGTAYANKILSCADLIISVGNRIHFNRASKTFAPIANNARFIRVDVDENELNNPLPNSSCLLCDLRILLCKDFIDSIKTLINGKSQASLRSWVERCRTIKAEMCNVMRIPHLRSMVQLLQTAQRGRIENICVDVGNHEFWISYAYEMAFSENRIAPKAEISGVPCLLYSKSFGVLGCAIPKSTGVYQKTGKPVLCLTGDQGFMFNVQELHFISKSNLPIVVVVLNNHASGMIRDLEKKKYGFFSKTTPEDGYYPPNIEQLASAFDIAYHFYNTDENPAFNFDFSNIDKPIIIELQYDDAADKLPHLPTGNLPWDFNY
ncbi:MAG: thiamine pyrophosphate-binding protein [Spirochaetota bacterium]|nr:thiamine pyrophosphate-binding protein [Spirochaetota bacterium]